MTYFQSFVLGIVQGITEFLPISSSGHLVLVEHWFHLHETAGNLKAFDVVLHAGTLLALLLFFYKDWMAMLKGAHAYITKKENTEEEKKNASMFGYIVLATIPAAVCGLVFNDILDAHFRTPLTISIMMFLLAIVFILADKYPKKKEKTAYSFRDAMIVGFAQCFALAPGVSRAGITISAGMFRGINSVAAARFSFLLGAPIIAGANIYIGLKIATGSLTLPPLPIVGIGFATSLIVSLISIKVLLEFLKRFTLKTFALYLIVLSILVFGALVNGNLMAFKSVVIDFLVSFFTNYGYIIVLICAFVEAMPLLGIIIPGGTIIILSGVFATEANLGLYWLILFTSIGAIVGDYVGYIIGKKYGEEMLIKYGPRIGFKEEYLFVTHRFCHQYGGLALVIGRFNNIVRPFVPMVVGASNLPQYKFWMYNILGGVAWSIFSVLIGYFARQSWEIIQTFVGIGGGLIFTGLVLGAVYFVQYEVKRLKKKGVKLSLRRKNKTESK